MHTCNITQLGIQSVSLNQRQRFPPARCLYTLNRGDTTNVSRSLTLWPPSGVLVVLNAQFDAPESLGFLGDGSAVANKPASDDSPTGRLAEVLQSARGETSLQGCCLLYGVTNGGRGECVPLRLAMGFTGVLVLGKESFFAWRQPGVKAWSGFSLRLDVGLNGNKKSNTYHQG